MVFLCKIFNMSFLSKLFREQSNVKNITAASLKQFINSHTKLKLIDVRSTAEHNRQNIKGSINIDVFDSNFEDLCETKVNINEPVLLYCRSGQRSMTAARKLEKMGYKDIYNLKGGMIAWSRL
ncbi:rhodanese-like domain-containing protein [Mesohalobacter halotolerans]|uniref:Rhodanese-like domain-containing protein n=2 Tax=Mesohalobacter halotolerans TaxID=1883405 RepID=A0A4U5TRI8_9FLAO|nr:rhodanese-like domain-containing protein [Mesohalobacter halotolerans]